MTLEALARQVQTRIPAARVRFAGERDLLVNRVALCSGSGGSLLAAFAGSGCEAYISGDLRYHDARWAEENGRGLIDIGHFASEHLVVADLAQRLQAGLAQRGLQVAVAVCDGETEPFKTI
jgi:putative NIF3 family GTP cyclohydrolase 1 type 2